MTDIGDLGGDSYGFDINNKSQAVGYSYVVNFTNDQHSFIYENGQMTDLGAPPLGEFSIAHGINDNGQIVGYAHYSSSRHAFLYDNGLWTDLGTLGGSSSEAKAINNSGQIVGNARTNTNADNAFLYENGQMTNLGTLGGGQSVANDINNYGQIVGYAENTSGYAHAFLYENGGMIDLGTLSGGTKSQAFGINDKGQIVGWAITGAGNRHAVLWTHVPESITIDIKPKHCPNLLHVKDKGVLPVAILGTADLDVTDIDITSLKINEVVSPIKSTLKNVAAPPNTCDCSTTSADALVDLTLKFDTQAIVATLGVVSNGEEITLILTGKLLDGTAIEGVDCVVIKIKGKDDNSSSDDDESSDDNSGSDHKKK
jgi:probable HAF family extracellular repeat protein